jgi:hypothetical protein
MDRNRILKLAVEELERQKTAIDAEIKEIRAQLGETRSMAPENVQLSTTAIRKRGHRTLAERKAQSLRMKKHWAIKRAKPVLQRSKP